MGPCSLGSSHAVAFLHIFLHFASHRFFPRLEFVCLALERSRQRYARPPLEEHKGTETNEQQHLASVRHRLDQIYVDKLDGKITDEFWSRKSNERRTEEQQILFAIQALEQIRPERMLDAARILELANKAYFLYVKQPAAEKARLLKTVLSNCAVDAVSIHPTYRKPFDLIFTQGKNEGWRARRDSNSRPSGSKPGGGKSQTLYRPLLTGEFILKTAPQLGYVGLQIKSGLELKWIEQRFPKPEGREFDSPQPHQLSSFAFRKFVNSGCPLGMPENGAVS